MMGTSDDVTRQLGDDIRRRRRGLGLRQEELADLAGTSARFVGALENGKPTIRLDKLIDILEVLGLELRTDLREMPAG